MGKIAFVEVLDKRGNIKERIRVETFPATVGRGYGNAVIVDDRLVNAEHLRLSLDDEGGIIVEDLNTVNGTRLSKSQEPIKQHRVPAGNEAVISVGQTVIRLRGNDFEVGPVASSRRLLGPIGKFVENGTFAFLVFVAGFGLNVLTFAQAISKKVIWSELTGTSLGLLIILALWTGFWSFLNRLIVHSFRFMTHLGIGSLATIAFLIYFTSVEYFEFFFSAPAAADVAEIAGFGVIFSLLLYCHLSAMSEFSCRKRLLSSTLISAAIVGIVLLISFTKGKEFSDELGFSSVIKPVGRAWVMTTPPDAFFGNLDKLKAKIDAAAQEGPKEKAGKTTQKRP